MCNYIIYLTVSVPVTSSGDSALDEVTNIESWASNNRMKLNFKKNLGNVTMYSFTCHTSPPPPPINEIRRKKWLKLLGVTFQENPRCWDKQVDSLLSKAGSRIYILRVCKFYGYSLNELTKLFDSLILSLFYYAIEVWGSALQAKYIDKFNKFLNRAFRYGYRLKINIQWPRLRRGIDYCSIRSCTILNIAYMSCYRKNVNDL